MTRTADIYVSDLVGGLRSDYPDEVLGPKDAKLAENCRTRDRKVVKRGGFDTYGAAGVSPLGAGPVQGMYRFTDNAGTRRMFVVWNDTLYLGNDGTGAFSPLAFAGGVPVWTGGVYEFEVMNDTLYIVNGNDSGLYYYDATAANVNKVTLPNNSGAAEVTPSFLFEHKGQMFVGGDPQDPIRLWHSLINDPTDWTTISNPWMDVDTEVAGSGATHGVGERLVRGINFDRQRTLLFTNTTPIMMSGQAPLDDSDPGTHAFKLVPADEGCISPRTVVRGSYRYRSTLGEGRLLACFYAHEDKLSGQCQWALYEGAAQLEMFAAAVTHVATECWDDLEKYCAEVELGEGRVGTCLLEHKAEVTDACRQAMDDVGMELVEE